jgi:hypothetical protein
VITQGEDTDSLALPPSVPVDWSSLHTRSWLLPIMAADWVRLSFLGPAAGMQLPMVRTHTNGSALASIMDVIPDFLPLCKFINSNSLDNNTIDPTFHFSLALSRQYEAPSGLPVPVFWDFVARFLLPFKCLVLSSAVVSSTAVLRKVIFGPTPRPMA